MGELLFDVLLCGGGGGVLSRHLCLHNKYAGNTCINQHMAVASTKTHGSTMPRQPKHNCAGHDPFETGQISNLQHTQQMSRYILKPSVKQDHRTPVYSSSPAAAAAAVAAHSPCRCCCCSRCICIVFHIVATSGPIFGWSSHLPITSLLGFSLISLMAWKGHSTAQHGTRTVQFSQYSTIL